MTEYKIASAIENYVTSHEGVTDFPVTIEQIRDEVDTLRTRMFDEKDEASRFTIPLEPFMQKIELSDPYVKRSADGKNTIITVPTIHIRVNGKAAIQFCGSASYVTPFWVVTGTHRLYAGDDPIIGHVPTAHYEDGVITLYKATPKKVIIRALFSSPSELAIHGYNWKVERYPVPKGFADLIIGKTSNSYLQTMYRLSIQPNTQTDTPTGNARSSA